MPHIHFIFHAAAAAYVTDACISSSVKVTAHARQAMIALSHISGEYRDDDDRFAAPARFAPAAATARKQSTIGALRVFMAEVLSSTPPGCVLSYSLRRQRSASTYASASVNSCGKRDIIDGAAPDY